MYDRLILAIPHAVRRFRTELWSDRELVEGDADRWTDWYTDEMFAVEPAYERIVAVIGDVSRFDCDLERLMNDPLEEEGRGILYRVSHSGATRELTYVQKEAFLRHWTAYRARLAAALIPNSLLIDCHSFPSLVADVDICIGFNQDETRPATVTLQRLEQHFRKSGFSVGMNTPYSNSLAPEVGFPYQSVMIELNKRLYLCESRYQLLPAAEQVKQCLKNLYRQLLEG